jgi:hypothetical protein
MNATHALTRSVYALSALWALVWPAPTRAGELPSAPAAHSDLARAMASYERCDWVQAFNDLAILADAGNAEAARIALLMRAHGTRLFGQHFVVGALRSQRWLDAASGEVAPILETKGASE